MKASEGGGVSMPHEGLTGLERLGLRVSAMINSPPAQLGRRVLISQLDTDSDQDWKAIIELLAETDGLEMRFYEDGSVILQWGRATNRDEVIRRGDELIPVSSRKYP